ncbi:MAG: HU family DNA-binding protein [Bacteroidaceae bacterium]|nr:HU family DNA-binding protein [Bacteroidaceae bacterium]
MDNKINLSQLAERLAQEGGMSKAAAEQFVKNFFDIISQRVLVEGLVKVKGLGTFKLIQMEDRESVNVNTGERFTIEGHQKISFVPDADLKDRINKPFAAFDTVEISKEQAEALSRMDEEDEQEAVAPVAPAAPEKPAEEPKKSSKEKRLEQKQAKKAEEAKVKAQKQQEKKETAKVVDTPTVKDITQKKGTRCLLKVLIAILTMILVIGLVLFMLWPVVGNSVLDIVEKNLNKAKIEMVSDSVKTVAPAEVAPVKAVEAPAETESAKPAESPAVKPAQPQQKPAEPAVKPAETPARTEALTAAKYPVIKLNSKDEAKDLSEFTLADVVNFSMEGVLDTYTLKKGETLTIVALNYYGSKKLWPYIAKYNNIKDPARLKAGTVVKVPVLKSK